MSRRFFSVDHISDSVYFSVKCGIVRASPRSVVCMPFASSFFVNLANQWTASLTHSLSSFLTLYPILPPIILNANIVSLSLRCDQPQSTVEKQKAKTNMKSLKSLYNSIRSESPFRNSGESARNSPRNSTRNQNVELAIISTFTPLPTIKF